MNKSLVILTVFLVSVSALRVHQQALQPRGNSSVPNNYYPNNYVPNNNQGGYRQPGNNNQGGYTQPGNNNQGGYTQPGNNNQGGFTQPGNNNQGGYTQPGNNNQGGYTQPGNNNQGGYTQPGNNNQQRGSGKCDSSKPGYIESRIPGPYNKPYLNQPFPQRNANGQVSLNGVVFSFQNPFKLTCYNKDGSLYRWNSCFDVFNCAQMFKDYTQCQGKIVKENVQFDCS